MTRQCKESNERFGLVLENRDAQGGIDAKEDPVTVTGMIEHVEIVAANLEEEEHWEDNETYVRRLRVAAAKLATQQTTIILQQDMADLVCYFNTIGSTRIRREVLEEIRNVIHSAVWEGKSLDE